MKKTIVGILVCVVVVFGLKACSKGTPDPVDVAKAQIMAKFEGVKCDLSKLEFEEVEVKDDVAKIKVEGKVAIDEEITLVKKDGAWVVGVPEAAVSAEGEKAKEEPHATAEKKEHE